MGPVGARERGYALLVVIVTVGVLLVTGMATIQLVRGELRFAADHKVRRIAFHVAEAGIQRGVAELDADRSAASSSNAYSQHVTDLFGDGSFSVSLSQDPLFSDDPRRKIVESTGTLGNRSAKTKAHVHVQEPSPCRIVFSQNGDARILTNLATITTIFDGRVIGNRDVKFNIVSGVAINAEGTVRTGGDFVAESGVSAASTLAAELFREGSYVPKGLHSDILGLGIHFQNGIDGHGELQAMSDGELPRPAYGRLAGHPQAVLVYEGNVPFGSWDSSSDTWVYTGGLGFPAQADRIYYVKGNADLSSVSLDNQTSGMIVTEGWLSVATISLVTSNLTSGSVQELGLIAKEDVVVGRQVTGRSPLQLESETDALLDATTGIGLAGATVSHTNKILFHSDSGPAWTKVSALDALSDGRVSVNADKDSTLAFNGSIGSKVRCPY